MLYGLLVYAGTNNLGDEIQSLATRRFLPRVDYQLNRDSLQLNLSPSLGPVRMILNGWFMHKGGNSIWPPDPAIQPLITSFHIAPSAHDFVLSPAGVEFLRKNQPIGCRDLYTLGVLKRIEIESFFSACMALTLDRPNVERDENLIVANDVSENVLASIAATTEKQIVFTSHGGFRKQTIMDRFQRAEFLLELYARASCVVTTRLHCALPCIAMNTPVLLVNKATDTERFFGLNGFVHNCSEQELTSEFYYFDWQNPPSNPNGHVPYRNALITTVQSFIQGDV